VTLWPRSLFGRLVLLLIAVVAISAAASLLIFRYDRAALMARQFGDTKIVQLQALRAALENADAGARREYLGRLGREYGVRIIPDGERPRVGLPAGAEFAPLESRLKESLGPATELHLSAGRGLLLVKITAGDSAYWIGFPTRPLAQEELPTRALMWTITVFALLLVIAYLFARYLAQPLRELAAAVARVGRGETPPPLPESGPTEIASVNRGFNAMLASLRQIEHDRALLLAGISHDLRTPLARLRLGVEMGGADAAMHDGMVADIEEMDRIVGQFLDFARGDEFAAVELANVNDIVRSVVARYGAGGREVAADFGALPDLPLRVTAVSRMLSNLIDNAFAYGKPPVGVATRMAGDGSAVVVDVVDRGEGVDPREDERMKQPFTRSAPSRSRNDGAAGAGLGLAIVERVARLHGGTFDLLPREGGGTIARIRLPLSRGVVQAPRIQRAG
jgi:two-component system osmolarity sensor histidine kinase EnvZ